MTPRKAAESFVFSEPTIVKQETAVEQPKKSVEIKTSFDSVMQKENREKAAEVIPSKIVVE